MQTRRKAIILFGCILLASPLFASDKSPDAQQQAERLQSLVMKVLQGEDADKILPSINGEAYVMLNSQFESLRDVIAGRIQHCTLNEGDNRAMGFLMMQMSDDLTSAFMILKTESKGKTDQRFHTITASRTANGSWILNSWHASQ